MSLYFDLRQLRYFLVLAEELNFGRAAARLHLSQPPLSRQIRQLEEALGVLLFQRHAGGVNLTEAGAALRVEARKTLAQAERVQALARTLRPQGPGRFRLGYTTVFDTGALADVAEALRQRFADWRIELQGRHSIHLVRAVAGGALDAALVGLHTELGGLPAQTLWEEPMVLALPAAHALARRRALAWDELRDEPLFWFERRANPGFYAHAEAFFERLDYRPRRLPEPADHHALLGLIAQGQGLALIPASLRQIRRQGVVYRPLKPGEPQLCMGLVLIHPPASRSPLLPVLAELCRARGPG